MKKKLVSIIINCFNGEKYLSKTLASVLNQKYQNFEVIFIDNCSTDSSAKIFKNIKDKRFKYFKTKKKIKLYASRNFALKKANGNYIAFLDCDDWWYENFLSSRKSFFSSSDKYGFCFSNYLHYHQNRKKFKVFLRKILPSGFILSDLLDNYFIKISTVIIKKKLIKFYKFNPYYNIIGDYDLMVRVSQKFKAMAFQEKLAVIRFHEDNFTHNNRKMFYNEYKVWINQQDFSNKVFKKNKVQLFQRLEYLRLIYLVLHKKSLKLFFDIIKFPSLMLKLKLLIIYLLPEFIIRFNYKYL